MHTHLRYHTRAKGEYIYILPNLRVSPKPTISYEIFVPKKFYPSPSTIKIKQTKHFLQWIIRVRVSCILILVQHVKFSTFTTFCGVVIATKIKRGENLTGDKQGMLVNNECSSWCNRVPKFLYQFGIGQKKFYTAMDEHVQPDRTTPLHSAWLMALSAMTVKYERFIYLLFT